MTLLTRHAFDKRTQTRDESTGFSRGHFRSAAAAALALALIAAPFASLRAQTAAQSSTTAPASGSSASASAKKPAGSKKSATSATSAAPAAGYDYKNPPVQPAVEKIDLDAYARIRNEGLEHSHIMEYASGLFDGIGPRLTGSPNLARADQWAVDQLKAMGASDPRLESWGEFGLGWKQIGTSVYLATPDTAVLIGQATPWSPATNGSVTAPVIAVPYPQEEAAFEEWKGKLAGKIILLGNSPKVPPDPAPLLVHYDDAKLAQFVRYPFDGDVTAQSVDPDDPKFWANVFKQVNFRERIAKFAAD
jgi:carboxypeptidase Q